MSILAKFSNPIEVVSGSEMITEVEYSELSDVLFNTETCNLNSDNRIMMTNYIDSTKYIDETFSQYKVDFEPAMRHYFFLMNQQKSL